MRQIAEQALDIANSLGASYADARVIEQQTESIETKNLTVAAVNMGSTMGLGIRVLVDGGWGFSSTQDLSTKGIKTAAFIACAAAKASASCLESPITWASEPIHEATWNSPWQIDPFTVALETKIAILLDAAKIMLAVKGITLARGMMVFIKEKKYYANSEGSRIEQNFIKTGSGIEAYATNANERQRRSYPNSMGGQQKLAGFEAVTNFDLPGNAERIANEVVALLSADDCPVGKHDVILGSSQLGLQIHESMGHPSELDRALGWEINFAGASFLTPEKLGKLQYGSRIVNLVADATAKGALGSFGFDDEGVAAQKTYLVKDGIFTGYLSSRDTVHLIGQTRSGGCMRAESWSNQPIIRMTNISLEPGNAGTLEDLIADTDRGILFETNKSWSIDQLRYNFQFSTEIAWEIEKGRRKRLLKNASYGGITPEFWNSCDAICDEREYFEWGLPNCGKGQPMQLMWTGHGASPSRFRQVNVGMANAK